MYMQFAKDREQQIRTKESHTRAEAHKVHTSIQFQGENICEIYKVIVKVSCHSQMQTKTQSVWWLYVGARGEGGMVQRD